MVTGYFIALEGADGAGKTTQIKLLQNHLLKEGIPHIITREPGGCEASEQIREVILNAELSAESQLLLVNAARREHLRQVILPAIEHGKLVICDRFIDSTLVYQGLAGGQPIELIKELHRRFCDDIWPDLTVLFEVTPEIAASRKTKRGTVTNNFESEEFQQKVIVGFKKLTNMHENMLVIDASKSAEQQHELIIKELSSYVKKILY